MSNLCKLDPMRLLLSAEPYGYGPAAAAASFMKALGDRAGRLSYAGEGHTLDLHRDLPYSEIHDMTGLPDSSWRTVFAGYDALLTATDARVAALALDAGLRVALYDPLAWYWDKIPPVASKCLYIAQDFFGVRERLAHEMPSGVIVPPLVTVPSPQKRGAGVFLNLGGLDSPVWEPRDADAYAVSVISAVRLALPPGSRLEVAANSRVSRASRSPDVRVRGATEMAELMSTCRRALMTPGLGNIYEAAAHALPVAWLPPVNPSQARQLALLEARGMAGVSVAWRDVGVPDPFSATGGASMGSSAAGGILRGAVHALGTPAGEARLHASVNLAMRKLGRGLGTGATALVARYGSGGATVVADTVLGWLNQETGNSP